MKPKTVAKPIRDPGVNRNGVILSRMLTAIPECRARLIQATLLPNMAVIKAAFPHRVYLIYQLEAHT